jgi:hypothetical protein
MGKYIQNPEPITLTTGVTYSLKQLVTLTVDAAPDFQKPFSNARIAARVLEALDTEEDGWWYIALDSDWKFLRDTLEKFEAQPHLTVSKKLPDGEVQQQHFPIPAHKLTPLVDAVDQARNSKPVGEKPVRTKPLRAKKS